LTQITDSNKATGETTTTENHTSNQGWEYLGTQKKK